MEYIKTSEGARSQGREKVINDVKVTIRHYLLLSPRREIFGEPIASKPLDRRSPPLFKRYQGFIFEISLRCGDVEGSTGKELGLEIVNQRVYLLINSIFTAKGFNFK